MAQWRKTFNTLGGQQYVADPRVDEHVALQRLMLERQRSQQQQQLTQQQLKSQQSRDRMAEQELALRQQAGDFRYGEGARSQRQQQQRIAALESLLGTQRADSQADFQFGDDAQQLRAAAGQRADAADQRAAAAAGRDERLFGFRERALTRAEDPDLLAAQRQAELAGLDQRQIEAEAAKFALARGRKEASQQDYDRARAEAMGVDPATLARLREDRAADSHGWTGDATQEQIAASRDARERAARRERVDFYDSRGDRQLAREDRAAAREARGQSSAANRAEGLVSALSQQGALGQLGSGGFSKANVQGLVSQALAMSEVLGEEQVMTELLVGLGNLDRVDPDKAKLMRGALWRAGITPPPPPRRKPGLLDRIFGDQTAEFTMYGPPPAGPDGTTILR